MLNIAGQVIGVLLPEFAAVVVVHHYQSCLLLEGKLITYCDFMKTPSRHVTHNCVTINSCLRPQNNVTQKHDTEKKLSNG